MYSQTLLSALIYINDKGDNRPKVEIDKLYKPYNKSIEPLLECGLIEVKSFSETNYYQMTKKGKFLISTITQQIDIMIGNF